MSLHISIANRAKKAAPRLGDALREGEADGGRNSRWPWRGFVFLLGLGALFTALSARSSGVDQDVSGPARSDDRQQAGVEVVTDVQPAPKPTDAVAEAAAPKGPPASEAAPVSGVAHVALAAAVPEVIAQASGAAHAHRASQAPGIAPADAESIGAGQVAVPLQGGARGVGAAPVTAGEDAAARGDADVPSEPTEGDAANELGELLADLDRILEWLPEIQAEQIMDYAIGDILREVPVERVFSAVETGNAVSTDTVLRLADGQSREAFLPDDGSTAAGAAGAIAPTVALESTLGPMDPNEFGFL